MSENDTIYRAERPDQLRLVALDPLTAIHHRRSGATHLVAEPVPQILAALQEGEADLSVLAARLAERFDLDPHDGETQGALAARLEELAALGLVRRVPFRAD